MKLYFLIGIAAALTACKNEQPANTFCVDVVHSNKRISMYQMRYGVDLIQGNVMAPFGMRCETTCPVAVFQTDNVGNPSEPHIMDIRGASYPTRSHKDILKQAMYKVLNSRTYSTLLDPDYFWEANVNYPANLYTEIFKSLGNNIFVLDAFTNIFFQEANLEVQCEKDEIALGVLRNYGFDGPGENLARSDISLQCINTFSTDCSAIANGTSSRDISPDCFIQFIGSRFKFIENQLYLSK